MDRAQVGVLEQVDKVSLARLLQRPQRVNLPTLLAFCRRGVVRLRDLTYLRAPVRSRTRGVSARQPWVVGREDSGGGAQRAAAAEFTPALHTKRAKGNFRIKRSVER
jgi:hypothetical protein